MTQLRWRSEGICARDLSIVLINSENKYCSHLCCVLPEYEVIGRTMAELITGHIPDYGSILLCAGNPKWDAHALIAKGFEAYMTENGHTNMIYKDHSWKLLSLIMWIFLISCPDRMWRPAAASILRVRSCWEKLWRKRKKLRRFML